jgi:hypothetical protein
MEMPSSSWAEAEHRSAFHTVGGANGGYGEAPPGDEPDGACQSRWISARP